MDSTVPIAENPVTQIIYSIAVNPDDTVLRLQRYVGFQNEFSNSMASFVMVTSGMVLTGSTKVQRVFDRVANSKLSMKESRWHPVKEFECEAGTFGQCLQAKLKAKLQDELSKHKETLMTSLLHPSVRALATSSGASSEKMGDINSKPKFQFDLSSEDSLSSSDENEDKVGITEAPVIMSAEERREVEADRAERDILYRTVFKPSPPQATSSALKSTARGKPKESTERKPRPLVQEIQTPVINSFTSASKLVSEPLVKQVSSGPDQCLTPVKSKFFDEKRRKGGPLVKTNTQDRINSQKTADRQNQRSKQASSTIQSRLKGESKRKKMNGRAKKVGKRPIKKSAQNPIAELKAVRVEWEIEEPITPNETVPKLKSSIASNDTSNTRSIGQTKDYSTRLTQGSISAEMLQVQKSPHPCSTAARGRLRGSKTSVGRSGNMSLGDEPPRNNHKRARKKSSSMSNRSTMHTSRTQKTIDSLLPRVATPKMSIESNSITQSKSPPRAQKPVEQMKNTRNVTSAASSRRNEGGNIKAGSETSISTCPSTYSRSGIKASPFRPESKLQKNGASSLNGWKNWASSERQPHKCKPWNSQIVGKPVPKDLEPLACNLDKQFELVSENCVPAPANHGSKTRLHESLAIATFCDKLTSSNGHEDKDAKLPTDSPVCSNQSFSPPPPRANATALYTPATQKELPPGGTTKGSSTNVEKQRQEWTCNLYLDLVAEQSLHGDIVPLSHILLGIHELGIKDLDSLYFDLPAPLNNGDGDEQSRRS